MTFISENIYRGSKLDTFALLCNLMAVLIIRILTQYTAFGGHIDPKFEKCDHLAPVGFDSLQ